MRIKSIKPTNKYKKIKFGVIKEDYGDRILRVLTPSGWSTILNFGFIKSGPSKIIKTDNDILVCDPSHQLKAYDGRGEVTIKSKDLNDTHLLYSYDDTLIKFEIQDGDYSDFYDITIAEPHWYYTSDLVSHNSILLCNNAMSSFKGIGPGGMQGQDVLFITYELDVVKTALRCIAAATNIPIDLLPDHKELALRTFRAMQNTYNKRVYIHEWAPEECSVDHIYQLLSNLKKMQGWKPDTIIIDYMDLMISRKEQYNKDDYDRLKHVATEIRGLAKKENVLVFTATQTNRSGMDSELIDLRKSGESFGKQFALDYVISLNQSIDERTQEHPQIRMFIAKNRNGPKHETITCDINYKTMLVTESKIQSLAIENVDKVVKRK